MKFSRSMLIVATIVILTIGIILILPDSSAERKGEDGDPPEHADWIIDSTGNYIGNETYWFEIIENPPPADPTIIDYDEAVKLDGNIVIKDGGVLTLYNASLNMTDHNRSHIIIEENGTLIMQGDGGNSTCMILNNNLDYIGYMEIMGNLHMNLSGISRVIDIYVNSSQSNLSFKESSFNTKKTFYLRDQVLTFDGVSFMSDEETALSLYNVSIDWKIGMVSTQSNITDFNVLHLDRSEIVAERLTVTTSSDDNTCIYLVNSAFSATNKSRIGNMKALAIYAEKSYINLSGLKKLETNGSKLLECYDSHVRISDTDIGYYKFWQRRFMGNFHFEDCDVRFENMNFFRFNGNAIDCESTDLVMNNSNLWNISQDAIHLEHGNIRLNGVAFYNVKGDAIHLTDVKGDIINCTIEEDDPYYANEFPFPSNHTFEGNGILGYGIYADESRLNITYLILSNNEKDGIHLLDSSVRIENCIFLNPGNVETTMVHGIYMENSVGIISNNHFNNPYRNGGFDLFGMEKVPLNLTDFVQSNNFSDGRTFQQQFTLYVRVVDAFGSPVNNADVNLTDQYGGNRKLSKSGIDGWTYSSFTVPAYEIFRYSGFNNQTNESYENFTNSTYNDYHLIVIKEYKIYNFSLSTELNVNISCTMNLYVELNVSTPEISIKAAGIFPTVLKGQEIEITVVLENLGERMVNGVNISYYYAMNDTQDWTWFGSDIVDIPGLLNGGNHSELSSNILVNAPIGSYILTIIVDPENIIEERNETNNNFTIPDAFEVFTRPRIFIDHPLQGEIVNGTCTISGYAEDDYSDEIHTINLEIDGILLTVSDITPTPGIILWSFNWDTAYYDKANGRDKYPNGPHNISVRCKNSNPPGYDTSDWINVTVTVVNVPVLHFQHPEEGELVNETVGIPLYKGEVKVEVFHDLSSVKLQVDDGPLMSMSLIGNIFSCMMDTSKYADGYHTLRYEGVYGYGDLSETVNILLNSPAEETKPTIDAKCNLTDEGLTLQGTSSDDFRVEWVKVRLDEGSWITVNESGEKFTTFEYFWPRGELSPDSHWITIRAYDGFDMVEEVEWKQVGLLYDLSIKDIILPTNVNIIEGDRVNFTVVVENTGPYASPPVNLILYIGIGRIMRTMDGITIPANSEKTFQISWYASSGNHSISAEINPTQKNDETDPTNNNFEDGYLFVEAKETKSTSGGSDYDVTLIAVVIMVILGVAAGVSFLFAGKKKKE